MLMDHHFQPAGMCQACSSVASMVCTLQAEGVCAALHLCPLAGCTSQLFLFMFAVVWFAKVVKSTDFHSLGLYAIHSLYL